MTSDKPTRQQIIDALRKNDITLLYTAGGKALILVEQIADTLVRAGLAVEPREPGWYWVRTLAGEEWAPLFCDGEEFLVGNWEQPEIIGPRIPPPQE